MLSSIEKVYASLIDREYQQDLFGGLPLFQRKGNGFIACCPFHNDSMPTLLLYGDRPEYFCFACSDRGDWIKYLMKRSGLSFREAVMVLQDASGIPMHDYSRDQWEGDLFWIGLLEAAMDSFIMKLWSETGEEGLHYLYHRGYSMGEVKGMSLGFFPGIDETRRELLHQGIDHNLLDAVFSRRWTDHRNLPGIVIPYRDAAGRLAALVHKDMNASGASSYRMLTDKACIEGIPFLMYRSRAQNEVLVVQGFFDALLLDQARLKPVIGTGSEGMSDSQLETAAFLGAGHLILSLGSDAEQAAMTRDAIQKITKKEIEVSVLQIPPKFKDLDEYIRMTCLDQFKALLRKAVPARQWLETCP